MVVGIHTGCLSSMGLVSNVEHYMIIDMHVHLYEYRDEEIRDLVESHSEIYLVAVSDDYESSLRTIEISKRYQDRVKPCIGLHPWEVGKCKDPVAEAGRIIELALKHDIDCLGEIGLDTRFVPETIDAQRKVFDVFLEAARDHDLLVNVHAAGTWEEVLRLLKAYGVRRANIHWYTGPITLLDAISSEGYTVSVNPSLKIQKKQQEVVRAAPLSILTFESDAPYEYKGLKLSPLMIKETISMVAELKSLDSKTVAEAAFMNSRRVLRWPH